MHVRLAVAAPPWFLDLGFRVQGSGFRVQFQDLAFRALGSGLGGEK